MRPTHLALYHSTQDVVPSIRRQLPWSHNLPSRALPEDLQPLCMQLGTCAPILFPTDAKTPANTIVVHTSFIMQPVRNIFHIFTCSRIWPCHSSHPLSISLMIVRVRVVFTPNKDCCAKCLTSHSSSSTESINHRCCLRVHTYCFLTSLPRSCLPRGPSTSCLSQDPSRRPTYTLPLRDQIFHTHTHLITMVMSFVFGREEEVVMVQTVC